MRIERVRLLDVPFTPWKNAAGHSRELCTWPRGAGIDAFACRIAVATIAQDNPFSVFPGVLRQIMLLAGAGVRLRGGVSHDLVEPLTPFVFDGGLAVHAQVIAGATQEFNLLVRRGKADADLSVWREAAQGTLSRHGLLMAWDGDWRINLPGAAHEPLSHGSVLIWHDASPGNVLRAEPRAAGEGALIVVRVQ